MTVKHPDASLALAWDTGAAGGVEGRAVSALVTGDLLLLRQGERCSALRMVAPAMRQSWEGGNKLIWELITAEGSERLRQSPLTTPGRGAAVQKRSPTPPPPRSSHDPGLQRQTMPLVLAPYRQDGDNRHGHPYSGLRVGTLLTSSVYTTTSGAATRPHTKCE